MSRRSVRSHKHFRLDAAKIKRAQRAMRAGTETETVDRALDFVLSEHRNRRRAARASERFVSSKIAIEDVYGTLEP